MFGCNNYHVLILISWGGGEGGNMKQYATYNVVISNYCVHECDCRFYRISDMHGINHHIVNSYILSPCIDV